MSVNKLSILLYLILIYACFDPVDSGVIKKIKETVESIKGYFRHNHSADEHCDQSGEATEPNQIVTSEPTVTSTGYPKIDVRLGEEDDSTTPIIIPNLSTRRLIDPGSNDECPEGSKRAGNRCRKAL